MPPTRKTAWNPCGFSYHEFCRDILASTQLCAAFAQCRQIKKNCNSSDTHFGSYSTGYEKSRFLPICSYILLSDLVA